MDFLSYQNSSPSAASLPAPGPVPVPSSPTLDQTLAELSAPSTKLSPLKRELVHMIRSAEEAYAYVNERHSGSEAIMKLFAGAPRFSGTGGADPRGGAGDSG